ncbi:MAG: DUF1778 domain-containing protein [Acidobacteria bacterium]|nr:DUF1778 domain-containing protein [Acidobacteriota bacterium]
MALKTPTKQERLQIRVDDRTKRKLERAAALLHVPLGDFVLSQAIPAAEKVIADYETITLSEPDWNLFYEALIHPPAPNDALRAAWLHYQEMQEAE